MAQIQTINLQLPIRHEFSGARVILVNTYFFLLLDRLLNHQTRYLFALVTLCCLCALNYNTV